MEKNQTGGSSSTEVLSVNTEVGHFCGKDYSSQASHKWGSSTPLLTSNTDKQCNLASPVDNRDTTSLSSGGSPDSGDNGRVSMVGSRGNQTSVTTDHEVPVASLMGWNGQGISSLWPFVDPLAKKAEVLKKKKDGPNAHLYINCKVMGDYKELFSLRDDKPDAVFIGE